MKEYRGQAQDRYYTDSELIIMFKAVMAGERAAMQVTKLNQADAETYSEILYVNTGRTNTAGAPRTSGLGNAVDGIQGGR